MDIHLSDIDRDVIQRAISDSIFEYMRTENFKRRFDDTMHRAIQLEIKLLTEKLTAFEYSIRQSLSSSSEANIRVMFHSINVPEKLNAEDVAIDLFNAKSAKIRVGRCRDSDSPQEVRLLYLNSRRGIPDLYVYSEIFNKILCLVEVKTNGDGLAQEQVRWALNHKEITVIAFYIEQKIIPGDLIES